MKIGDLYGILHFGRVVLVNNIVTITIFWSDFHREVYYIVRVAGRYPSDSGNVSNFT